MWVKVIFLVVRSGAAEETLRDTTRSTTWLFGEVIVVIGGLEFGRGVTKKKKTNEIEFAALFSWLL